MPVLTRSVRGSGSHLLYHVLEEPQLMAAVRELPPPALVRLIHHVGLEDAGELIALTSTQQLGQVFDAELWQAAEPGSDETFRPERFAMFLHLLYEAGETFVVERLLAMPRELLTLAVHKLLLVIDIDALTVRFNSAGRFFDDGMDRVARAVEDAHFEEWEEFRLIGRDPNAFEDVWNALLALDRENHELVRYIMERCCDMDGELIEESGLHAVLNEEDMLENDIASERGDRRAAQGFVSPADARAFLELARREKIDEAPDGRDPIARAYFRELEPELPVSRAERALPAGAATPDVGRLLSVLRKANVFDDERDAPSPSRLLAEAEAKPRTAARARKPASAKGGTRAKAGSSERVRGAAIEAAAADQSSSEASEAGTRRLTLMASSLLVLRAQDAALHAQRTEELGFLANVLVAGSRHDGRTYRPVESIECALAVCSIGIERRVASSRKKVAQPTAAQGAKVLEEMSGDRLFRLGLHVLRTELGERARAVVARLLSIKLVDAHAAVSGGSVSLVPLLAIDAKDAVALGALAEPEPWLTGTLAAPDHLFLASDRDVQSALEFLASQEE
jgi:hypothetical protein